MNYKGGLVLLMLGISIIIIYLIPQRVFLSNEYSSISYLDSVNEVIQGKPLLAFTDYSNDLDTLMNYSSLNYRRMFEQASTNELKLALKNEIEHWEECFKHLRNLCSHILEVNFGSGTISIPLSQIYASYVYSLRAEMSDKEVGLLGISKGNYKEYEEKLDLEELLIDFQNSIHYFCDTEWKEDKEIRVESCKEVGRCSEGLINEIRVWKHQRDKVTFLFIDEYKRNSYNHITDYYLRYVFKELIPQVLKENGRTKIVERYD